MADKVPKVIRSREEPISFPAAGVDMPVSSMSSVPFASFTVPDSPLASTGPSASTGPWASTEMGLPELEQLGIHQDPSYVATLPSYSGTIRMPSNVHSLEEWGTCLICYGKTYKGQSFRKVYDENPDYRRWVKTQAKGEEMEAFRQYILARERIQAHKSKEDENGQLPITLQMGAQASTQSP